MTTILSKKTWTTEPKRKSFDFLEIAQDITKINSNKEDVKNNLTKKIFLKINSNNYTSNDLTEVSKSLQNIKFEIIDQKSLCANIKFENSNAMGLFSDVIKLTNVELNDIVLEITVNEDDQSVTIETKSVDLYERGVNIEKAESFFENRKPLFEKNIISSFSIGVVVSGIYNPNIDPDNQDIPDIHPNEIIRNSFEENKSLIFSRKALPYNCEFEKIRENKMTILNNNYLNGVIDELSYRLKINSKSKRSLKA